MKMKGLFSIGGILFLAIWILASCSNRNGGGEEAVRRASDIHDRVLTIDTHCDTPMMLLRGDYDMSRHHGLGEDRQGKIDLPRMKEGGLDAEFFAAFVGQGPLTRKGYGKARERAFRLIDAIHGMCMDFPELVGLATTPEDAYRLEKEGRRAAFIGMENGYPIGEDLGLVQKFYNKGVRYITLSHSSDNQICDSSTDRADSEDRGLSGFGGEVVAECNRLGIMVDVSHISEKSFFDVLETSRAPVIASHSSARALCDHPRNLSDEQLEALAENNGVIQICILSSFLKPDVPDPERDRAMAELRREYSGMGENPDEAVQKKIRDEYREFMRKYPGVKANVQDAGDHIDHVVNLIGIDHVGIGTDFDGGGGIEGCIDVSEMPNITAELIRRGYSEEDIRKIWGGNLIRVFKQVIETAANS